MSLTLATSQDAPEILDTAPANIDAEQAFLGALLFDNEVYHAVSDWLKPSHFHDPVHGRIYESACELIGAGALADAVALKSRFDRDESLETIGGTEYLAVLIEGAATSKAAVEYARIVYDLAGRRELVRIADALGHAARMEPEATNGELIEGAESDLFQLAEQGTVRRGLKPFQDALDVCVRQAQAAHEQGGLSGLSTGLRALDEKLHGLHPSDLIILAGRPSMGKTALATNIAYRAALRSQSVAFFSLEMSEDQLAARILSDRSAIPGFKVRAGTLSDNALREWIEAAQDLRRMPLHIDDTGGISVAAISARARRMKRQHGLDLIVIDYLQLMTAPGMRSSANRVEEVSKITTGLKALAKELQVPVLALSQLSRNVENREDKKPQLSDLRESGSIEQDADVVLFVYREAYYKEREKPREDTPEYIAWEDEFEKIENIAEVIIGKQRHGPIGTAKLHFDGQFTRFSDLTEYA